MNNPPTGTVTFLFTDIEGSTKKWEQYPDAMGAAVTRHDVLLREAIEVQGGYVFKTVGDAFCAAFGNPQAALAAALSAQRTFLAQDWSEVDSIRARMAMHTGIAEERDGDYFGQPLNRVARLLSAGHGGQTLLSLACQELLRDALPPGIELRDMGEHRLKDLFRPERIFQVLARDLPTDFSPLTTLDNRPNNLPRQTTPLIGREKEVAEVCNILCRPGVALLTLTGPGGTGKTRLGLQAAADMVDDFPDGSWFVELAPLTDASLVVSTIAQELGVKEAGGQPLLDTLKGYLRDKELLLLLDNFEQVAQAAPSINQLLVACPHLKVLTTSRSALNLRGEHEYAVLPLELPDPKRLPSLERLSQYESVRLFIERAQAVKSDFVITNEDAPAIAEICVRLDGLPLAIELAAARIKLLPPQAMLARLQARLKLLTGGARDLPARQQTLRGAIEWSYELLDEGEKQLFRRMAVFQGGRTFEAVEAVCNANGDLQADVLEGVGSLLGKSLLQQRKGTDEEPRFWMLETIHEFAREAMAESGEADVLHHEHAAYFLRFTEEAELQLTGGRQAEAFNRLEEEHDNLRAALEWSLGEKGSVETALRMCWSLWRFWVRRGHYAEGRRWTQRALASGPNAPALMRARVHYAVGLINLYQGDTATAVIHDKEALALFSEVGDKRGMSWALNDMGNLAYMEGDLQKAITLFEESLVLKRELGDQRDIAIGIGNLGEMARFSGDYERASSLFEESLTVQRQLKDKYGMAITITNIGYIASSQGDHDKALVHLQESLAICWELGDKVNTAGALAGLAGVAVAKGQAARAARLFGAVEAILDSVGALMNTTDKADYEQNVASARAQLGEEAWQAMWAAGRAMRIEQAIAYALEDSNND